MGTTADKLQAILNSKNDIKAAIEEKGVSDVGDVLSTYADKIRSISTGGGGGGTKWTGHADVEGLKAIGWTDEDIEYYQNNGVNWNEEDDEYHKVPQDNIALYGTINASNIKEYKDILVYLPKIDTSSVTDMSNMFNDCYSLVAVPLLNTSKVTDMPNMFNGCKVLTSIPELDVSNVIDMGFMFNGCENLTSVSLLNASKVKDTAHMFYKCYNLAYAPELNTSNVISIIEMFGLCSKLKSISLRLTKKVINSGIQVFTCCYDLRSVIIYNPMNLIFDYTLAFRYCYNITNLKLEGIQKNLNISFMNLLTKDSLLYIIQNSTATSNITITLTDYIYNKFSSDPDIVAALEEKPYVALAS